MSIDEWDWYEWDGSSLPDGAGRGVGAPVPADTEVCVQFHSNEPFGRDNAAPSLAGSWDWWGGKTASSIVRFAVHSGTPVTGACTPVGGFAACRSYVVDALLELKP